MEENKNMTQQNENMEAQQDQEVPAVVEKKEGKVKTFLKKAEPIAKKVGKVVVMTAAVVGALTIGKAIGRKEAGSSDLDPVDADWEEVPVSEETEETFES